MRNRYIVFTTLLAALTVVFAGCSRNPEVAKKKYLESGLKYVDQQKYDSAAIQFKKALQIDPKFAEAHYRLALADIRLEKRQEAFKEMSQAVELDPNNLKARIDLGGMYLSSGPHFYSNAEEQARYVVEHDPNSPEAQVQLGNVMLSQ
jgi:Tfp pilus assembly protein PilF